MAESPEKNDGTHPEGGEPAVRSEAVSISDIEKLFVLMRDNEIAELELEQHQTKIHIVSKGSAAPPQQMMQYMPAGMQPMQMMPMQNQPGAGAEMVGQASAGQQSTSEVGGARGEGSAPANPPNSRTVLSPMVGTFYRSPGPDSALFVNEGDVVNEETVLCIIEAMKLMNEIKAETRGKILRVLVENGMPVEFNQPLFLLEP